MTREEFRRRRRQALEVRRRGEWLLAAFSVPSGIGLLLLIRWAELNLDRRTELAIAVGGFLLYAAVLAALFVAHQRRLARSRLACADCGHRFEEKSAEVAMASGRCGGCGATVFRDA